MPSFRMTANAGVNDFMANPRSKSHENQGHDNPHKEHPPIPRIKKITSQGDKYVLQNLGPRTSASLGDGLQVCSTFIIESVPSGEPLPVVRPRGVVDGAGMGRRP